MTDSDRPSYGCGRDTQLTSREEMVVGYVLQGLSTDDIARRLGIRPATVRSHLSNVYEKLGAGSIRDLRRIDARSGIERVAIVQTLFDPCSRGILIAMVSVFTVGGFLCRPPLAAGCAVCSATLGFFLYLDSLARRGFQPGLSASRKLQSVCFLHSELCLSMRRRYMLARGLSPLQVDVVIGIVDGLSGREIAHRLNYSLGSINVARLHAYRLLDVHSSDQLAQLFSGIPPIKMVLYPFLRGFYNRC